MDNERKGSRQLSLYESADDSDLLILQERKMTYEVSVSYCGRAVSGIGRRREGTCRLPQGHTGRCSAFPSEILQGIPTAVASKINTAARYTRGNELPFFNRSVRWNRICLLPGEDLPPDFPHRGVVRQINYSGRATVPSEWTLGKDYFLWLGDEDVPEPNWEKGKHYLQVKPGDHKRDNRIALGIPAKEFAPEDVCFQVLVHLARLVFYMIDAPDWSESNSKLLNYYIARERLLDENGLKDFPLPFGRNGLLDQDKKLICPLCLQRVSMSDLIGKQGETPVDLFHVRPLKVGEINHNPTNVTWGHHLCNVSSRDRSLQHTLLWMRDITVAYGLAIPRNPEV